MLPLVLTKKQKVLIVGAGRACEIKLRSLSSHPCDITVVSKKFLCETEEGIKKVQKSFEELTESFFEPFDLIYIAVELKDTSMVEKLLKTKMVNVTSNPALGNFIHPCNRNDGDINVSVNSINKPDPKTACKWAEEFIEYKRCRKNP
jgi:siroheme synthase (precorrin-2 oxidase/ferrochelatase)